MKSAVRNATLKDGAVTNQKLAGGISWNKLNHSSIPTNAIPWTNVKKPDDGIPGAELKDLSITGGKLAAGSVTSSKISVNISNPLPFTMYSLVFEGWGTGFLPLSGYFKTLSSTFVPVHNSSFCQLFHLIAASNNFLQQGL